MLELCRASTESGHACLTADPLAVPFHFVCPSRRGPASAASSQAFPTDFFTSEGWYDVLIYYSSNVYCVLGQRSISVVFTIFHDAILFRHLIPFNSVLLYFMIIIKFALAFCILV